MKQEIQISNRTVLRVLGVIAGFIGAIFVAWLVREQLAWIFTAAFLAIALNPAVEKLSKALPRKSRGLAAGIVFTAVIAILAFLAATLVPPVIAQSQGFAKSIPGYFTKIQDSNSALGQLVNKYHLVDKARSEVSQLSSSLGSATSSVFLYAKSFFGNILSFLTIAVLTFFMLTEGPAWVKLFWKYYNGRHKALHRQLVDQMYRAVSGYVVGNLITSAICAFVTGVALTVLGVPYAISIAILVGLLDLLPLVGASLGAVVAVSVGAFKSLTVAFIIFIFFVIYQQVENNILQPYVYGKTVQMSPLTVFLSAIIGASIGGLLGALVAVPIGASVQILVKAYLQDDF